MAYLFVQHQVKDYPAWKATFDGFIETRRASGEKSWQIFHPADDPNNLLLLFEWDSLDNARTFMTNSELKEAMGAAGVIGAPEVYFLERYDQGQV